MVSNGFQKSIAQGYLVLTNLLGTARIEKLEIPELVQAGSMDVVLDCQFVVPDERFSVQWWFNSGADSTMLYEWTPPLSPRIVNLKRHSDFSSEVAVSPSEDYRGIRLLRVDPHLSGEYTCVVTHDGVQARAAKRMLVFSPEEELEMTIKRKKNNHNIAEITCFARAVYPQPDLILEYDKEPISQQVQRVWHPSSLLKYDVESKGELQILECERLAVTCRLHLPLADYTAIKKKTFSFDNECSKGPKSDPTQQSTILLVNWLLYYLVNELFYNFT